MATREMWEERNATILAVFCLGIIALAWMRLFAPGSHLLPLLLAAAAGFALSAGFVHLLTRYESHGDACRSCSAEIDHDFRFCLSCGEPVREAFPDERGAPERREAPSERAH
ncbi:MAG: hypothetical protein ACT4PT_02575 [Methanobacteriota archaeon]